MSSLDSSDPQQLAIDEVRNKIIRAEKDAMRASQELKHRMHPEYVKRQIRVSLNRKVEKFNNEISQNCDNWRVTMLNTLTKNPLSTALVGVGLYLLMKNSSEVKDEWKRPYPGDIESWKEHNLYNGPRLQDRIKDNFDSAKEKVQEQMSEFQNRATELKDQAGQKTQELKEESEQKFQEWKAGSEEKMLEMKGYVRKQANYAKGEFNQLLENNPLALGGIMLAIGAVVAATLPSSRKENQLMGESRHKMVEAVKTKVRETVEDVKEETKQMAQNVSEKIESTVS